MLFSLLQLRVCVFFAVKFVSFVKRRRRMTHADEMCNLYVMYYTANGHQPYFTCETNTFPSLFDHIPPGNDVPLPPNPLLDAIASGHVHKGIACCLPSANVLVWSEVDITVRHILCTYIP